MFFRMGGMPPGFGFPPRGPPRPKPVAAPVQVTLEELMTGAEKVMDLDDLADPQMKELGLKGKVDVKIKPGMREGSRVAFPGRGILLPGTPEEQRGDLTAIVEVEDHPRFRVQGDDLMAEMEISLAEALTGFTKEFVHLDGSLLYLHNESVVKPGQVRKVEGKGLPVVEEMQEREEGKPPEQEATGHGDLLLSFKVVFPRVLADDQVELLKPLLPSRTMTAAFDPAAPFTETEPVDYDPEEWMNNNNPRDDDSDEDDGGPRVACAHQ